MDNNDTLTDEATNEPSSLTEEADKLSIASEDRLSEMLREADKELSVIQPEIDQLEESLAKLQELKKTKQKLLTLKLSVQSILNNYTHVRLNDSGQEYSNIVNFNDKAKQNQFASVPNLKPLIKQGIDMNGAFYPDEAFEKAGQILKQKNSLNHELFRAIVLSGGCAATQTIKDFLLEHDIRLPASGETFEAVPLTDISARVNYLIRKGLVTPVGRGLFKVTVGWSEDNMATSTNQEEQPAESITPEG